MSATIEEIKGLFKEQSKEVNEQFKEVNEQLNILSNRVQALEGEMEDIRENEGYKRVAQMHLNGGEQLARKEIRDIHSSSPFRAFGGSSRDDYISSFDQG